MGGRVAVIINYLMGCAENSDLCTELQFTHRKRILQREGALLRSSWKKLGSVAWRRWNFLDSFLKVCFFHYRDILLFQKTLTFAIYKIPGTLQNIQEKYKALAIRKHEMFR